jgi:hypothetical protein
MNTEKESPSTTDAPNGAPNGDTPKVLTEKAYVAVGVAAFVIMVGLVIWLVVSGGLASCSQQVEPAPAAPEEPTYVDPLVEYGPLPADVEVYENLEYGVKARLGKTGDQIASIIGVLPGDYAVYKIPERLEVTPVGLMDPQAVAAAQENATTNKTAFTGIANLQPAVYRPTAVVMQQVALDDVPTGVNPDDWGLYQSNSEARWGIEELDPNQWSDILYQIACARLAYILEDPENRYSHDGLQELYLENGIDIGPLAGGKRGAYVTGENLNSYTLDVQSTMDSWLRSQYHREAVLSTNVQYYACATGLDANGVRYSVELYYGSVGLPAPDPATQVGPDWVAKAPGSTTTDPEPDPVTETDPDLTDDDPVVITSTPNPNGGEDVTFAIPGQLVESPGGSWSTEILIDVTEVTGEDGVTIGTGVDGTFIVAKDMEGNIITISPIIPEEDEAKGSEEPPTGAVVDILPADDERVKDIVIDDEHAVETIDPEPITDLPIVAIGDETVDRVVAEIEAGNTEAADDFLNLIKDIPAEQAPQVEEVKTVVEEAKAKAEEAKAAEQQSAPSGGGTNTNANTGGGTGTNTGGGSTTTPPPSSGGTTTPTPEPEPEPEPEPTTAVVPWTQGYSEADAIATIQAAGFRTKVERNANNNFAVGVVYDQSMIGERPKNILVIVYVSTGPRQ